VLVAACLAGVPAVIASPTPAAPQAQQAQLKALAKRVDALQTTLSKRDPLGARVSGLPGSASARPPADVRILRGQGGLLVTPGPMTPTQINYERERLEGLLTRHTDHLEVLDRQLIQPALQRGPVPTVMPIAIGLITSAFGVRTDPITRSRAMHEGQDFAAPVGTPILAAASGIVIEAYTHPEYGQMIDIDHGNDLVTRYAHASSLMVRRGDLVRRGQQIARVGSTGRSTGAHLHFEVRTAGVAVDPVRFLGKQARPSTVASALGGR
jgi:murein DD-endopeptidase MepM/ murein hydrolase activator NlpD